MPRVKASKRSSVALPERRPSTDRDPVSAYAWDVLQGKVITGQLVRLACERHFRDLAQAKKKGFEWRPDIARHAIQFVEYCRHSKGEWAGQRIRLTAWQQFVRGSAFGWLRANGTRRFRVIYEECARKNGKSTNAATVALKCLIADGEPGADVFSAAPLALDTLIPTIHGWKTMGELTIGDVVFSETGDPCNVTYVSPVLEGRECYELKFTDETTVVCDSEHRWLTDATQIRDPIGGSRSMPTLRREGDRKAVFSLHNRKHYVCAWDDLFREESFERALSDALTEQPLSRGRLGVRTTADILASLTNSHGQPNHRVPAPGARSNHLGEICRVINYD